jgi:hypothetical protein
VVAQAVAEAVQPYSPEYRRRGAGEALIAELGRFSGARVVSEPAQVFTRPDVARQVPRPLWPPLVVLAAILLVLDVAARRLDTGGGGRAAPAAVAGAQSRLRWSRLKPAAGPSDTEAADIEVEPDLAPPEPEIHIPDDSYAGRLLAARKKARDKLD